MAPNAHPADVCNGDRIWSITSASIEIGTYLFSISFDAVSAVVSAILVLC